jgi:hypothetical protein
MTENRRAATFLAIITFLLTAGVAVGGSAVVFVGYKKYVALAAELQAIKSAVTKECTPAEPTVVTTPPPPKVSPPPDHITYRIKPGDRTMYDIHRKHCRLNGKKQVSFEQFQDDMLALNQHEASPRRLLDKQPITKPRLATIHVGKEFWWPLYCTGLTP